MRPFWWFSNTVRGLLQKVDIPKVPRHRQKILCNKSLENLYFMTIGFSDIFPLTSIEMSSYPQQKTSWKLKPVIVMWNQNSLAKGEEARTRGTFKSHITPGFSPLCSFNNPKTSGVKNFFYHTTTTFLLHLAQPSSLLKSSSMPYWPNIPCIGVCNLGFSKSFFWLLQKNLFKLDLLCWFPYGCGIALNSFTFWEVHTPPLYTRVKPRIKRIVDFFY